MPELTGQVGFASPTHDEKFRKRRVAGVELIATLALAISLVIAATAVSIGAARAQALGAVSGDNTARFAIAALLALPMAAMGGLTALIARER